MTSISKLKSKKKDELIELVQALEKTVDVCTETAAKAEKQNATKVRKIAKLESSVNIEKGKVATLEVTIAEMQALEGDAEPKTPTPKKRWWQF